MKKDDTTQDENQNEDILQQELDKIVAEKEAQDSSNKSLDETGPLEMDARIITLESEKKELQEIARKAQYDYINLKMDFDRYQKQSEEKKNSQEVDALITVVKRFLPFLEDLRKSLSTLSDDQKQESLAKGVQMVYDKFLQNLEKMNVFQIESLGLVPDSFLHEPVSVLPVEDEKLKGKIIQEYEKGFIYKKDDNKVVIVPAKVIVGN